MDLPQHPVSVFLVHTFHSISCELPLCQVNDKGPPQSVRQSCRLGGCSLGLHRIWIESRRSQSHGDVDSMLLFVNSANSWPFRSLQGQKSILLDPHPTGLG